MISQNDIDEIVKRIAKGYDPMAIILFGSYAKGTASDDSDLDLFILKEDRRRPVDRTREVRRLLLDIVHPIDIFVRTRDEYNRSRSVLGTLAYEVDREGRVLYEQRN